MNTKSRGRLTVHGLACGFVEQKSTNPDQFRQADLYTELYREDLYHVVQFDRRPGARKLQVFWKTFTRLQDARNLFDLQPGEIVHQ
jgi:hypothetical protein